MPHYKDISGNIHFIDNAADAVVLPKGCVEMTQSDVETLRRPTAQFVWGGIKAERDRRKVSGVKVGDHWFHSDDASRIQHMALVMMGTNIPVDLRWKTMGGTFVSMTRDLAASIFNAVAINDQSLFANAERHRLLMESSIDPSSYDYSSGWPAIYGE